MSRTTTRFVAALLVLATALACAASAQAARKLSPAKAAALEQRLGGSAAGTYRDPRSGNMVIAVSTPAAARRVRAAGGIARLVPRSGKRLDQVVRLLRAKARIAGTAWALIRASTVSS